MPDIVVFATDLHGNIQEYENLLELGSGRNVRAVIIGGDISPFLTVLGDIALYQRDFLESYLLPRLRDFRDKHGKDVFLMLGNDDLRINEDVIRKGEKEGLFRIINNKVYRLGKLHIAGYSFINETPFMLKDWEKSEKSIKKDLLRLAKKSNPRKTIYSVHAPPLGTALDVIFSGEHVGSSAIREFIEEKQPYLTLHGHIHESPQISGQWKEVIGKTISVNPGKRNVLVFDMNDLRTMEILS